MQESATGPATVTVADLIRQGEGELAAAGVVCAQGTATHRDEAAAIVYHALGLEHADPAAYGRPAAPAEVARCEALLRRRVAERIPAAYLLGEAWFAGLPFYVDRRGCIAVACALAFPQSEVVATDFSVAALEVARRNVARHGVAERVRLLRADLYAGIAGRFDLIVSNPPYVPDDELRDMPPEFAWEPRSALAGGADGLDLVRRIVTGAPARLAPGGLLAIEVGGGTAALEAAFPAVPFIWPEFEHGGDGIAVVAASDLPGENAGEGHPAPGS